MRHVMLKLSMLLVLAVVVAACGGGGGDSAPTATPNTQGEATATTDAPTSPAATPSESEAASPEADVTPTAEAAQDPPAEDTPASGMAYGFNIAWRGDDDGEDYNRQTLEAVQAAGFNWVRIQVEWSNIERRKDDWHPLGLDRIVDLYDGSGVQILVSVVGAPEWARDPSGEKFLSNYADMEGFMHFLAERYRGRVQAWEIWNEQNIAENIGDRVEIEDYARLLQAGYTGVKLADPEAIVVFGGLTPTGVNDRSYALDDVLYLEEFYSYWEGHYTDYFDVMGIHVSATNNPPDTMWPSNPGTGGWSDDPSFYYRRAEQLRQVMAKHGDDRPVWITEFGWTTENQAPGYEYGVDNSEEDQAEYLARAFEIALEEWSWVGGMFVWNLNFSTMAPETDEKYPWSVLNSDWSPRPAYEALTEMPKP